MRVFCFILIMCLSKIGFGKNNEGNYQKIRSTINATWYCDSAEFFQNANYLIKVTSHTTNYEYALHSLWKIAQYHSKHNNYEQSLIAYKKALQVAHNFHDAQNINLFSIRMKLVEDLPPKETIDQLLNLMKVAQKKRYILSLQQAHQQLAIVYTYYYVDLPKATKHAMLAETLAKENKWRDQEVLALNTLSGAEKYAGLIQSARKHMEKALRLCGRNPELGYYKMSIAYNLIDACLRSNDFESAATYKRLTSILAKKYHDKEFEMLIWISESATQILLKNYKTAMRYCDSIILYQNSPYLIENDPGAFIARKGYCALMINDLATAKKCYNQLQQQPKINKSDSYTRLQIFNFYADYYKRLGQYQKAFTALTEWNDFKDSLGYNKPNESMVQIRETQNRLLEREYRKHIQLKNINKLQTKQIEIVAWRNGLYLSVLVVLLTVIGGIVIMNRRSKQQSRLYKRYLIQLVDSERARIARDLHDDIVQLAALVKSKVHLFRQKKMAQLNEDIEEDLDEIIRNTREISHSLHPVLLKKIGLSKALDNLMKRTSMNTGLTCVFKSVVDLQQLPENHQKELYHIVKECLSNTLRHSQATEVSLDVHLKQEHIMMVYLDNGSGFTSKSTDLELLTIKERCALIGGKLFMTNLSKEKGFKLIIQVPVI
jgi:signal transduction histidine kinase